MRTIKLVALLAFTLGFLLSTTSCVVTLKSDNGNHKGWYKNPNNPHHPHTTNPGKVAGKHTK
jgi:hypothetical protein